MLKKTGMQANKKGLEGFWWKNGVFYGKMGFWWKNGVFYGKMGFSWDFGHKIGKNGRRAGNLMIS